MLSIGNIASIITTLVSSLLAVYIIGNNYKSKVNLTFGIFTLCVSGWVLTNFLADIAKTPEQALFWARMTLATPSLMPILLLYFSKIFPREEKPTKPIIWLLLSIPALIILALTPTKLNLEKVVFTDSGQETTVGPLYTFFFVYFAGYIVATLFNLYRSYRKLIGSYRLQITYLFYGLSVSIILSLISNVVLLILGFSGLASLGPLSSLTLLFPVGYAIVKHRLLDIRLVVARTVAYSLLIAIIGAFYTFSTLVLSTYFLKTSLNGNQIWVYTILTLIVAFTFQPLRRALETTTDQIFYKGHYDSEKLLKELSHIMATTINLNKLTEQVLSQLLSQMRISRGAIVLTEEGKIFDIEHLGFTKKPEYELKDIFMLESTAKTLVFEELEEDGLKNLMRKLDLTVSIPLKAGAEEIGLLLLGEKQSGDIYSDQDIKLLEISAPEASVAIQNAKAYEEIRRFNITLKEEVEAATKALREANEKLKDLDKLKDEFLSIASHDLRTPMTAIKSYLWLALNGRAGDINDKLERYLDISYQSSERMLKLISDLLSLSRIERGKVELTLEPQSLEEQLEIVLFEQKGKAQSKNINLTYHKPTKALPKVLLDKSRFPEIMANLVGNALKFTKEGGKVAISTDPKDGVVEVTVTDNGPGIGKDDLPKLFSKFGQIEMGSSPYEMPPAHSPEGTGLGLYITKSLVELHGGKIWVESQIKKGTKFTFTVKVATPEELDEVKSGVKLTPEEMALEQATMH